jgi:hypothetical protein
MKSATEIGRTLTQRLSPFLVTLLLITLCTLLIRFKLTTINSRLRVCDVARDVDAFATSDTHSIGVIGSGGGIHFWADQLPGHRKRILLRRRRRLLSPVSLKEPLFECVPECLVDADRPGLAGCSGLVCNSLLLPQGRLQENEVASDLHHRDENFGAEDDSEWDEAEHKQQQADNCHDEAEAAVLAEGDEIPQEFDRGHRAAARPGCPFLRGTAEPIS